jgi:hypothetical protein
VIIEIVGTNPPGLSCIGYENIHVGVGVKQTPVGMIAGDRPARWRVEVRTVAKPDGSVDFRGPFVHGPAGDRFLYLNWGTIGGDGAFTLFRRAKLTLTDVDPNLVGDAMRAGRVLTATINLKDDKGNPTCARQRAPHLQWSVTADSGAPILAPP